MDKNEIIIIHNNKSQININLAGNTTLNLPDSTLLESILCIDKKGSVSYNILPKNGLLILNNKENNKIKCSYLITNLYWKCIGKFIINKENNIMKLYIDGLITNNETKTLNGSIYLISEKNNKEKSKYSNVSGARMSARMSHNDSMESMKSINIEEEGVEDYEKYDIGKKKLEGNSMNLFPIKQEEYPYLKKYIINTTSNYVEYGYQINVLSYLPSCILNIYSEDQYIGSNKFIEGRKNDERIIIIGESSKIKCENSIKYYDEEYPIKIDKNTIKVYHKEIIECNILNRDDNPANIIIKHVLGNKNREKISIKPYNIKEGIAEWRYEVKTNLIFKCEITYFEIKNNKSEL